MYILRSAPLFALIFALSGLEPAAFCQGSGKIFHANESNPGSAIDLNSVLSSDTNTLLFIHSPHCGPCKRVEPKLRELARLKTDLKIVDLILDGPFDHGIGWGSAAAKQFDVHVVPSYIIFDKTGKQLCRGQEAKGRVLAWLSQAGLMSESELRSAAH